VYQKEIENWILDSLSEAKKFSANARFSEAKILCSRVLNVDPHSINAVLTLASIFEKEGDCRNSIKMLAKAITIRPGDRDILSDLIRLSKVIKNTRQLEFYESQMRLLGEHTVSIDDGGQQNKKISDHSGLKPSGRIGESLENVVIDLTLCGSRNGPNIHGGGIYGFRLADQLIKLLPDVSFHLLTDDQFKFDYPEHVSLYRGWSESPAIPRGLDRPSTVVIFPLPYRYFSKPRFGLQYARCMPAILGTRTWELSRQNKHILKDFGGNITRLDNQIKADQASFRNCLSALGENDTVLCLTDFVLETLQAQFPDSRSKFVLLPPLMDLQADPRKPDRRDDQVFRFLFMGAERNEKNFSLLLGAIEHIQDDDRFEIHVLTDTVKNFRALPKNLFILHKTPLPESDKQYLIRKMDCLIYPSLSEGFGMPPLEFFREGKEVIISAINPHLKIYSSVGNFINPRDPFDLYLHMRKVSKEMQTSNRIKILKKFFINYCRETQTRYENFAAGLALEG